jgi:hypothetical protein
MNGCDIDLYQGIVRNGYNWKYVLDDDGFDDEKILTQEQFFNFLNDSLMIKRIL